VHSSVAGKPRNVGRGQAASTAAPIIHAQLHRQLEQQVVYPCSLITLLRLLLLCTYPCIHTHRWWPAGCASWARRCGALC
jgi:hypothetical protein